MSDLDQVNNNILDGDHARLWEAIEDANSQRVAGDEASLNAVAAVNNNVIVNSSSISTEVVQREEGDLRQQRLYELMQADLATFTLDFSSLITNVVVDSAAEIARIDQRITDTTNTFYTIQEGLLTLINQETTARQNQYTALDNRVKNYEHLLSDITVDSNQITVDNGEIVMGAWTILSQAREWDLQILTKLNSATGKWDDEFQDALDDLISKIPDVQDVINEAIENLSQAPIIKELDEKLSKNIEDTSTVKEDLIKETTDRQAELLAQAQDTADKLNQEAQARADEIAAEAAERAEALAREARIRAEQLVLEAQERTAEIDEKIRDFESDLDIDLTKINNRITETNTKVSKLNQELDDSVAALNVRVDDANAALQVVKDDVTAQIDILDTKANNIRTDLDNERTERLNAIQLLNDGLTAETQHRKDGDTSITTALENYKASNDTALANVRTEIQVAVDANNATASRVDSLDAVVTTLGEDLTATTELAASALDKAEIAISENSALATRITTAEASITDLTNEIGNKADASAVQLLQSQVTNHEGQITTISSSLTSLQNTVSTMDGKVTANTSAISELETKQTVQEGKITQLTTDTTALKNSVESIEDDLATKVETTAFNQLKSQVTQQGNDITSLSSSVTSLNNELTVVKADVATKASSSALQALDSKVTTIDGKVTANANAITSLNSRMTTAEGQIANKLDASIIDQYSTTVQTNQSIADRITQYNASLVIGGNNFWSFKNTGTSDYGSATMEQMAGIHHQKVNITGVTSGVFSRLWSNMKVTEFGPVDTTEKVSISFDILSPFPNIRVFGYVWSVSNPIANRLVAVTPNVWTRVTIEDLAYTSNGSATYSGLLGIRVLRTDNGITDQDIIGKSFEIKDVQCQLGTKATKYTKPIGLLEQSIAANATAIQEVSSQVTNIDGRVTSNANAITSLNSRVTTVENGLTTKADATAVANLTTRVTVAEGTITSQGTDIVRLENEIDTIKDDMGSLATSSALQALDSKVTNIDEKVTSNTSAITSLSGRVTTVEQGLTTKLDASVINAYSTTVDMNNAIASSITTYNAELVIGGENLYLGANPIALIGQTGQGVYKSTAVNSETRQLYTYFSETKPLDLSGLNVGDATVVSIEVMIPSTSTGYFTFNFGSFRFSANSYLLTAPIDTATLPKDKWVKISAPAGNLSAKGAEGQTNINVVFNITGSNRPAGIELRWRNLMMERGTKASAYSEPTSVLKSNINANATAIQSTNASVTTLDGRVTSNSSAITSLNNRMTVAEGNISQKADASALSTLDTKVTTIDGKVTSQGAAITKLQNDLVITDQKVETKADSSAVQSLSSKVDVIEGTVTSNSTEITRLNNELTIVKGDVATKASAAALQALDSKVTTIDGKVTANTIAVTNLRSELSTGKGTNLLIAPYSDPIDVPPTFRVNSTVMVNDSPFRKGKMYTITNTTSSVNNRTTLGTESVLNANSALVLPGRKYLISMNLQGSATGLGLRVALRVMRSDTATAQIIILKELTSGSSSYNTPDGTTRATFYTDVAITGNAVAASIMLYTGGYTGNVNPVNAVFAFDSIMLEEYVGDPKEGSPFVVGSVSLAEVHTSLNTLATSMSALQTSVTSLDGRVTANSNQITNLQASLSSMQVGGGNLAIKSNVPASRPAGGYGFNVLPLVEPLTPGKVYTIVYVASMQRVAGDTASYIRPYIDGTQPLSAGDIKTDGDLQFKKFTFTKGSAGLGPGTELRFYCFPAVASNEAGRHSQMTVHWATIFEGNGLVPDTWVPSYKDNEAAINANANAISNLDVKVTQNGNDISSISSNLTTLTNRVTVAENNLNTKADSSALNALDSKVTVIDGKVSTNTNAITSLTGRVTTVEGALINKADASVLVNYSTKTETSQAVASGIQEFNAGLSIGGTNFWQFANTGTSNHGTCTVEQVGGNLQHQKITITGVSTTAFSRLWQSIKVTEHGPIDVNSPASISFDIFPVYSKIRVYGYVWGSSNNVVNRLVEVIPNQWNRVTVENIQRRTDLTPSETYSGLFGIHYMASDNNVAVSDLIGKTIEVKNLQCQLGSKATAFMKPMATIEKAINANAQAINTTQAQVTDINGRVTSQSSQVTQLQNDLTSTNSQLQLTDALTRYQGQGKLLFPDTTFKDGFNSIGVYGTNPPYTRTRRAKSADNPSSSTHEISYLFTGDMNTRNFGFVPVTLSAASGKVFLHKYVIKMPVGVFIQHASNSIGTAASGSSDAIIGTVQGIGRYETYWRLTRCGSEGPFSTTGHIAFKRSGSYPAPTPENPTDIVISQVGIWDVTDAPDSVPQSLYDSVAANASALTALDSKVTQQGNTITSQGTQLTQLQNDLTQVSNVVTTKADASALTTLDNKVTSIDGRVTTNTAAITNLTTRLTTAEGTITTQGSAISTLNSQVSTISGTITNQGNAITSLSSRVDNNAGPGIAQDYNLVDEGSWHSHYNMNSNPANIQAWFNVLVADAPVGPRCFYVPDGQAATFMYNKTPLPPKKYRVQFWAKKSTNADGANYITIARMKAGEAPNVTNYTYIAVNNTELPINNTWKLVDKIVDLSGSLTSNGLYTNFRLGFSVNNGKTAGEAWVQGFKITEVIEMSDTTGVASADALTALTTRVTTAEGKVDTQAGQITSINTSLSGKADNSAVTSLASRVTATEGSITSLNSQLTSLTTRVTTAEGNITSTTNALSLLNTKVTEIDGRVVSQADAITKLTSELSAASTSLKVTGTTNFTNDWLVTSGSGELSLEAESVSYTGRVLSVGNNAGNDMVWMRSNATLPFDETKLYRLRYRYRRVVGTGSVYIGLAALTFNRRTYVSKDNAETTTLSGSHYAVSNQKPTLGSWVTGEAYYKGRSAGAGQGSGTKDSPYTLANKTAYLSLMSLLNYNGVAGTQQIDYAILEEADAVVANEANAAAITSLSTQVNVIDGKVTSHASTLTQLQSSVGENTAKLQIQGQTIDGIKAEYTIKLDVNGLVAGIGLINTGTTSAVGINADYFYVGAPNNGKKPFIITTSPQTIGGVTYPAGTWMDVALIANATIGTAHIQDASITDAKIANLAVTNAKLANASISSAKIKDAAINTAHIKELAVKSAQIDSLAVTTAKIDNGAITTAKIGDLQVDTLQIKGNAVTVPSTSYVASSIEVPTSTWVTVASLHVEASEGPSLVTFNAVYNVSANGSVGVGCRILRGTAVVRDEFQIIAASLVGGNSVRPSGSVSTTYLETGQQNATIHVQMRSTTGTNITFSHRSLTSLVVKK